MLRCIFDTDHLTLFQHGHLSVARRLASQPARFDRVPAWVTLFRPSHVNHTSPNRKRGCGLRSISLRVSLLGVSPGVESMPRSLPTPSGSACWLCDGVLRLY